MSEALVFWVLIGVCFIARYLGETAWVCAVAMSQRPVATDGSGERRWRNVLGMYLGATMLMMGHHLLSGVGS